MSVVNAFLLRRRLKDQHPNFFVVPADLVKLGCEVEENSLLVDDFVLPLADHDLLVERVESVEHVVTMQRAVVSKAFQQLDNLLYVQ